MSSRPLISVIIPTRDRADLLVDCLASLEVQDLGTAGFEVVVVDDGSRDHTADVCDAASTSLRLRYERIAPSGIAAAKNLGIFAAAGRLVLFFDDDDIAAPDLLSQHVQAHNQHPGDHVAVLGFTTWSPMLELTALMHYVTDVGNFLFSYGSFTPGQVLDHTAFWGGRTSCKRALLVRHGVFDQSFVFGCEDIELGHRLVQHGFKVVYVPAARSYMNRPLTYEQFCTRCERQGRAQHHFGAVLNPEDAEIRAYCELDGATALWAAEAPDLATHVARVRELELLVAMPESDLTPRWREELHALYRRTFLAYRAKGIVEARA